VNKDDSVSVCYLTNKWQ